MRLQEQLNVDFRAAAYYINQTCNISENRENENHSTNIDQKDVLYQEGFLYEQPQYVDSFLEESTRKLQRRRWQNQRASTLWSWLIQNATVQDTQYILWTMDND